MLNTPGESQHRGCTTAANSIRAINSIFNNMAVLKILRLRLLLVDGGDVIDRFVTPLQDMLVEVTEVDILVTFRPFTFNVFNR